MRSLFVKIFFSFWLTTVLVGLAMYLVALATKPNLIIHSSFRDLSLQAAEKYGEEAIAAYTHGGAHELNNYVETVAQNSGIKIFLFAGDDEKPLTGQPISSTGRQKFQQVLIDNNLLDPPFFDEQWIGKKLQNGNTASQYIILLSLQDHKDPPLNKRWQGIGFHFLLSLGVGSLICLYLARSLTSPIRRLREATCRIAQGDFSARIGGKANKPGDEIVDLGRDFDMMAEQIEKLIQTQKRLQRDISHELRSPLARMNVALALARQRSGHESEYPLDRIEKEIDRLDDLIGQLLTLASLESRTNKPKMFPINLCDLVKEVAEDSNFETLGKGKSVRITHTQKVTVLGSAELLHSALENIVRNAIHYTKDNTEVEVALSTQKEWNKDWGIIKVRDHGPGVPEKYLEHLCKPFFRVGEARDRKSGGSGIGLAIAEQAIRLHSGTLTAVNSDAGGLIMEISIPVLRT